MWDWHKSLIFGEWIQTCSSGCISCGLFVIGTLCISSFSSSHKLSIRLISGEYPAHGGNWTSFWMHHVFNFFVVWHVTASCWIIHGLSPYDYLVWGMRRVSKTLMYLSWVKVPSTMCKRLVPCINKAPQTMIFVGNFTVIFRQWLKFLFIFSSDSLYSVIKYLDGWHIRKHHLKQILRKKNMNINGMKVNTFSSVWWAWGIFWDETVP